jgi:WD40 repeat protein/serine/threonine protein kinase
VSGSSECITEEDAARYVDGELPAEQCSSIERHAGGCALCRSLIEVAATLKSPEAAPPSAESKPELPETSERYTILGEHARGGQARVLLAYDEKLGREVALKELLPSSKGSAEPGSRDPVMRFVREAELTGKLVHPGVVPVFDVGRRPDGSFFYTMQLIRGRTLGKVLRERRSLRERLDLLSHFLSVCHVVAYAHSRGVLHRDIKPLNIMVGDFGETVLLDWGLAKRREADSEEASLPSRPESEPDATRDGTMVGTPGYMSPEQASGSLSEIDERSDIYGLGAVLFEILAGKPPPEGHDFPKGEPGSGAVPRVRALCPEAPPELASVAEKALAWDKRDRYQRASDLARDVNAFMTGARVAAHEYTSRDLVRRFAARHRILLGALAAVFIVTLSALVVTSLAWRSELLSRREAEASKDESAVRGRDALQEGAKLALVQGDPLQARAKLRGALELGDSQVARALWRKLRVDPRRFVADLGSLALAVSFSPDNRQLAVGLLNGNIQLIDVVTRARRQSLGGSNDQISRIAFSPDGELLASGTNLGRLALWDLRSANPRQLEASGARINDVVFSPDGSRVAVANANGDVVLWDIGKGAVSTRLPRLRGQATGVAFSPDGRRLAAGSREGKTIVWDLETKTPILVLTNDPIHGIAFSPDGRFVVGGGYDGNIFLWPSEDGRPPRALRGHHGWVHRLAVSRTGRVLASAAMDGPVRLWSLSEGSPPRVLLQRHDAAFDLALSADGTLLAVATGSVLVLDLRFPEPPAEAAPPSKGIISAQFSPDGSRIASAGADGVVRLWDTSGEPRAAWTEHEAMVMGLCFSPDFRFVASVGFDGALIIWEAQSGAVRHRLPIGDRMLAVACAPDSRHVVSGGYDRVIRLWDAISGKLVRALELRAPASPVHALLYSADGKKLFTGRGSGLIEVWEPASGRLLRTLSGHTAQVQGLAFDASERVLASASVDRSVRLWSMSDGRSRVLGGLPGRARELNWGRRDGLDRLAVPISTGEILIWDFAQAQPNGFTAHRGEANSVRFAPDGETAVSAGDDGVLRLWDTATWQPRWYTRAMIRGPEPQVLTHRGWLALDSARRLAPITPAASAWRRAVEQSREASMQANGPLCVAKDAGLEIWDVDGDALLASSSIEPPLEVAAIRGGCSVLKDGKVALHRPLTPPLELAAGASLQSGGDALAVVAGSEVMLFDSQGRKFGSFGPGAGVTALAPMNDRVAVGKNDGRIEVRGTGAPLNRDFLETPDSAVVQLAAGPGDTIAAGFADGSFGVWSSSTGERLEGGAVHGAVRALHVHDGVLMIASEVGYTATLDLSLLTAGYCDLLAEVWSRVPVLWRDGRAVAQTPDPSHRCRPSK